MKKLTYVFLILLLAEIAGISYANNITEQETLMSATGKFEVNLEPQTDDVAPAGRMIIKKSYSGALSGSGVGQMISKRTETGSAIYYAIEEFTGTLDGKNGEFTLVHKGVMDKLSQSLEVLIMEGSGKGELANIAGAMSIVQEGGTHTYELEYSL